MEKIMKNIFTFISFFIFTSPVFASGELAINGISSITEKCPTVIDADTSCVSMDFEGEVISVDTGVMILKSAGEDYALTSETLSEDDWTALVGYVKGNLKKVKNLNKTLESHGASKAMLSLQIRQVYVPGIRSKITTVVIDNSFDEKRFLAFKHPI
jgi:hypothetical protein